MSLRQLSLSSEESPDDSSKVWLYSTVSSLKVSPTRHSARVLRVLENTLASLPLILALQLQMPTWSSKVIPCGKWWLTSFCKSCLSFKWLKLMKRLEDGMKASIFTRSWRSDSKECWMLGRGMQTAILLSKILSSMCLYLRQQRFVSQSFFRGERSAAKEKRRDFWKRLWILGFTCWKNSSLSRCTTNSKYFEMTSTSTSYMSSIFLMPSAMLALITSNSSHFTSFWAFVLSGPKICTVFLHLLRIYLSMTSRNCFSLTSFFLAQIRSVPLFLQMNTFIWLSLEASSSEDRALQCLKDSSFTQIYLVISYNSLLRDSRQVGFSRFMVMLFGENSNLHSQVFMSAFSSSVQTCLNKNLMFPGRRNTMVDTSATQKESSSLSEEMTDLEPSELDSDSDASLRDLSDSSSEEDTGFLLARIATYLGFQDSFLRWFWQSQRSSLLRVMRVGIFCWNSFE